MQTMGNDRLTIATPDLRIRAILHEATARVQDGGSAIVMSALLRKRTCEVQLGMSALALHRESRVLPSRCSGRRLLIVRQLRRDLRDVLALIAGAVEFVSARLPRTIAFG